MRTAHRGGTDVKITTLTGFPVIVSSFLTKRRNLNRSKQGLQELLRLVTILCGRLSNLHLQVATRSISPDQLRHKIAELIPPQPWRLRPRPRPPPSPAHRKRRLLPGRPWGSLVLFRGRALDLYGRRF